jgi:hypothetical protein
MITGKSDIEFARMLTLKHMLRLEIKGMKRRGRSAYSIIKKEFGLTGSRAKVLKQFEELIQEEENDRLSDKS